MYSHVIATLFCVVLVTAQRNPPGVNPQHYQNQQMPQGQPQYQQPPQQYQQQAVPGVPPQQYQQGAPGVNPQQYQQQIPQQHQQQIPQQQQFQQPPPVQQQQFQQPQVAQPHMPPGAAHQPHGAPKVLHKTNLNEERAHIKDHLEVPLDTSGMSEQELQFHYFKMHDADNNNQLDGQELIKSLFHWHDEANHDDAAKAGHTPPQGDKIFTDEELTNMIDPILQQDDHNQDGYIDYSEFMAAQKKAGSTAEN